MPKLRKRYLIAKIENYYPGGGLYDVCTVTNHRGKAFNYVLEHYIAFHYIQKLQSGETQLKVSPNFKFVIFDLDEGIEYEFDDYEFIDDEAEHASNTESSKNNELISFLNRLTKKHKKQLEEKLKNYSGQSFEKNKISVSSEDNFDLNLEFSHYETNKSIRLLTTIEHSYLDKIKVL